MVYERINNGVYRAGFATHQRPYEIAARQLFETLDELDTRLRTRRYLLGDRMTEADWRLFPTLIRFDAAYHGHFKCNVRRIVDYANLWPYLRDLYQHDGVAETVNFDHIQTPLLHDARADQSRANSADRASVRPDLATRAREAQLVGRGGLRLCEDTDQRPLGRLKRAEVAYESRLCPDFDVTSRTT